MVFRESVEPGDIGPAPENRRDFLYIATGAVAVVGAAAVVWPFIDSMQPSADISAIASVEVDLSTVEPGQRLTVKWRGRPVFIIHRMQAMIEQARADDLNTDLIDPQPDSARVGRPEWLVFGRSLHPSRLHSARPGRQRQPGTVRRLVLSVPRVDLRYFWSSPQGPRAA